MIILRQADSHCCFQIGRRDFVLSLQKSSLRIAAEDADRPRIKRRSIQEFAIIGNSHRSDRAKERQRNLLNLREFFVLCRPGPRFGRSKPQAGKKVNKRKKRSGRKQR